MSRVPIPDWHRMPHGKLKYRWYLASPEWAAIRNRVRARSKGTCERCRNARASDVHHKTYARIYRENIDDLIHLCRACHKFVEGRSLFDPMTRKARRK